MGREPLAQFEQARSAAPDGIAGVPGTRAIAYVHVPPSSIRRILPLIIVAVISIPTLVASPPLIDLLGHIGRYAIQTSIDQHPWMKEYFTFQWRMVGNLGADILIQLLAPFFDVETSVRIILIFNQILAATAILALCREVHGRITPFCLFALPLIYSLPFTYGFINFTLSMALALLAFALWLRLTRTGRIRSRTWLFVPIGSAIWLCHAFGWAFLGLLCTAESLVRSRRAGRDWLITLSDTGRRCLPLAAPLVPMLMWRSHAGADTERWFQFTSKMVWLLSMLRLDYAAVDVLSAGLLLALIYFGLRSPLISRNPVLLTGAALCLFCFLLLPYRLFGSDGADMRLAPYMTIVALLGLDDRPLNKRTRQILIAAAVVFFAGRSALTTAVYLDREHDLETHLEAIDAIPEGARVATLVSMPCPSGWELPWLAHVGGMAIARKHVFANDQWAAVGVNLLRVHYPAAGEFAHDTSEMIYGCHGDRTALRKAVARLPAQAFTYLWIIGVPPREQPTRNGFTPVWRGPDSAVYRIEGA